MLSLISKLLRPGTALLNRLSLRTKLLGMFATLLIPIVGLTLHTLNKVNTDVSVAAGELQGVGISRHVMDILVLTQRHRGQVNLKLTGENIDAELSKTRSAMATGIDLIRQDVASVPEWQLAATWEPIQTQLRQLANGQIADNAAASIAQHTALIRDILHFSSLSAEQSGLLLDPEANTYFLMDASIQKIPVWSEQIALLRGLGAGFIKSKTMDFKDKAGIVSRLDALQTAISEVRELEGPLQRAGEAIPPEQQAAIEASKQFAEAGKQNLLSENITGDAKTYFDQGSLAIEKTLSLQKNLEQRLSTLLEKRVNDLRFSRNLIIVTTLLCFLFANYLLWAFYTGFMQAMQTLSNSALAVSTGDLTRQIHVDGEDELAQTGQILEKMNLNLSALVANVRSNSNMVSQLGNHLATDISDLSMRTEQQASSLEQTSASVEDLADTVKKNAESATAVDKLAAQVRHIAESSGTTMQSAVESMQGIQNSALKVQDIISIIDSIAFQTNILALNAAVEAARAGEQGRGFAVVASEVRGLAQRSADSAKEIRQLIDISVNQVKHGVKEISAVNQTLSDIVTGIRELATNINAISLASVEQSNGLSQISEALHHLDQITQQNGQMADQAKHTAINLEERAALLTQAVSTFKLRQGTADEAYAMVKKAVSLYRQQGRTALSMITANADKHYTHKDMYVFAFNPQGQYLAFGGNAEKLKVNLFNVQGLNGRKLVEDAFNLPEEGGWVDYSIVNPVSSKLEAKTSYIEVVAPDLVIGCGVYKV